MRQGAVIIKGHRNDKVLRLDVQIGGQFAEHLVVRPPPLAADVCDSARANTAPPLHRILRFTVEFTEQVDWIPGPAEEAGMK